METPRTAASEAWHPASDTNPEEPLPAFLDALIERLAEKVHDRWAERRLAEGWTYGPHRDDEHKTTPNLVPYDCLTETERAYDRATAVATLKNLHAAGYRVVPVREEMSEQNDGTLLVETFLAGTGARRFEEADLLWRTHPAEFWRRHPGLLRRLARVASDAGWPLLTYDMVSRTLSATGPEVPDIPSAEEAGLRHLAVLSLMEVGALERAAEELAKIGEDSRIDGDLQGLRGRLAKMRGLRAKSDAKAREYFREARCIYDKAYRAARADFQQDQSPAAGATAYYLGINAATMGAWAGDATVASEIAAEVLEICEAVQRGGKLGASETAWLEATRGEAHLLRGSTAESETAYRAAARALRQQWRPLQSMRRQALETARRTGVTREKVEGWFDMPQICVRGFPDSPSGRPAENSIVFFYLRDAGQLPEAAALAPASAEFHLCLEQPHEDFRAGLDVAQCDLLDRLEASSTRIFGRQDELIMGRKAAPAMKRLLFRGAVLLRAQELDLPPSDLPALAECMADAGQPLRALLCADAKGYSRLDNELLEVFVKDYLGCIAGVVEKFRESTMTVKTAGDGLFIVFRDLASAIHFSLTLRDATCAVDWTARGMPEDLGLRISLDAGPMLEFTDPVTGRTDVAGRLVNRAARIEPITPVNHVYASRTVAALATAMEIPGVRFEYAGETPLPKGFGAFQLYHLTAS